MALARRYTGAIVVLLTVCLVRLPVLAGTTGKIVGKVVDKATTEPLVGVNVVVEGTTLGAATDVNGGYIILKVAPGTYRLKASLVGYGATVVTDVRVYIDQTVTVPFELTSEAIVTGDKAMLAIGEYEEIRLVTLADYLKKPRRGGKGGEG